MRSLIPVHELASLDRQFGIDRQVRLPDESGGRRALGSTRVESAARQPAATRPAEAHDDDPVADLQARLNALAMRKSDTHGDTAKEFAEDIDSLRRDIAKWSRAVDLRRDQR
jgi:hypothetical protein